MYKKNKIMQKPEFKKGVTAFIVLFAAISIFFMYLRADGISEIMTNFKESISSMIYGVVIAYLLNPIMKYFQKKMKPLFIRIFKDARKAQRFLKYTSITVAMIVGVLVIAVLGFLIIPELYNTVLTMINEMPETIDNTKKWVDNFIENTPFISENFESISQAAEVSIDYITDWISTDFLSSINKYLGNIVNGIVSIVNVVIDIFIGLVVAVYALNEKEKFVGQSKKIVYAIFPPKFANEIVDVAMYGHRTLGGFVSGRLLDSLIVGIICFISLTVMDMPYIMLVSVLVGVTNIVPFFGPFIGAIPSIILITIAEPIKGVYFSIFIIVLQQIDGNIIGPKILGNTIGISEFWVTFALLWGGGLFGFAGMLLGVPVFAIIYYILSKIINYLLDGKGMSTDTDDYISLYSYDTERNEIVSYTEAELRHRRRKKRRLENAETENKIKKENEDSVKNETNS